MKLRQIALLIVVGGLLGIIACTTSQKKEVVEKAEVITLQSPTVVPVTQPVVKQVAATAQPTNVIRKSQKAVSKYSKSSAKEKLRTKKLPTAQREKTSSATHTVSDALEKISTDNVPKRAGISEYSSGLPDTEAPAEKNVLMSMGSQSTGVGEDEVVLESARKSGPVDMQAVFPEDESSVGKMAAPIVSVPEKKDRSLGKSYSLLAVIAGIILILVVVIAFIIIRNRKQMSRIWHI